MEKLYIMPTGWLIRNGSGMTNVSFQSANLTAGKRVFTSNKQWTTTAYGSTYNAAYRYGNNMGDIEYRSYTIPVPSGSRTFTSSGTFTVPTGVTKIKVFCVGGGSAGSSTDGGGGGYTKTSTITVSPGQQISVTIGAGGIYAYGENESAYYRKGGDTTCGSVTATGAGDPSGRGSFNGGSGGGCGGTATASYEPYGGNGGSDGSNGSPGGWTNRPDRYPGGTGQGSTTRAYGESSGTLYAGGGGGGFNTSFTQDGEGGWWRDGRKGKGGAGGGAAAENSASANTGGGGGGATLRYYGGANINGGNGGSGICLIKWGPDI